MSRLMRLPSLLRRIPRWTWPVMGVGSLLVSFYLLGQATENSADFGRLYSWLFVINGLGLILLTVLIAMNLFRLWQQYRLGTVGTRLTFRLLTMFIVLSLAPVSIVFYYSVQFLNKGIDSWYDAEIDRALEDAVALSQSALDQRMKEHLQSIRHAADTVRNVPDRLATLAITDMRAESGADELTLIGPNGSIIASSSNDPSHIIPDQPGEEVLTQVRNGQTYVAVEQVRDKLLGVRVVLAGVGRNERNEERMLQGLYAMPERISSLADNVQQVAGRYDAIVYLREPLKTTFTFTLFTVLLLSMAFAVWAAIFFSRRLIQPIRDLAEGTRAVADGDYSTQLSTPANDDISLLVHSFNIMTRRLATARDAEIASQAAVESQRAYLATVLANLSSGVLTVDKNGVIRTLNGAAGQILGVDPGECSGKKPSEVASRHAHLQGFIDVIAKEVRDNQDGVWQREITVFGPEGRIVLMCRGSTLADYGEDPQAIPVLNHPPANQPDPALRNTSDTSDTNAVRSQRGNVIVFDDITELVKAQRDSAWGEVARRLAHEIKNPLTPIQLSAERLQHRLLKTLEGKDADIVSRSTTTIIHQVEAMKEMVNTFRDYAQPPQLAAEPLNLNNIVQQVMDLYRSTHPEVKKTLDLAPDLPLIKADQGRLRQVLHNLIKNAIEALHDTPQATLALSTRCVSSKGNPYTEILICDNGPGFSEELKGKVFEPYITDKPKGTGLGLAIVKKIIEEHGGMIRAENRPEGGALISIRLPVATPADDASRRCANRPGRSDSSGDQDNTLYHHPAIDSGNSPSGSTENDPS